MLQTISQLSPGVTAADGVSNTESVIWDIETPETVMRIMQGNHKLRLDINTAAPADITAGTVLVRVADPLGNHVKVIYRGDLALFTGAQINSLEVETLGNTWGAFPFYRIQIVVNATPVTSEADSTFGLQVEQMDNISFEEAKQAFPEYLLG